jgi:hypothetical protein
MTLTSRRTIHFGATALLVVCLGAHTGPVAGQAPERVRPIPPPETPLPPEDASNGITRFSFLAYGDTRGLRDGVLLQPEHSLIVDSMLEAIKRLRATPYPVKFVLQSGDAVVNGADAHQWNQSYIDVASRLTKEGDVPYFLIPGNHDVTSALTVDAPGRKEGLRNFLDAMAQLMPREGGPRRLAGYPAYAFGYGNTFVLGIDSNIAGDERQFAWARRQLEGLDRTRYVNVIAFFHHPPFSSGPHGGVIVEPPTATLRAKYLPLFNAHHVKAVFVGHEHLFEHWVEHYSDTSGAHRMDLIVSAGGGAPLYSYQGEPDTTGYVKANKANKVSLEHLVRPGPGPGDNPYHFLIVRVDGERLSIEVVGIEWGVNYRPYGVNTMDLQDR